MLRAAMKGLNDLYKGNIPLDVSDEQFIRIILDGIERIAAE
jgi:hypothetical protein